MASDGGTRRSLSLVLVLALVTSGVLGAVGTAQTASEPAVTRRT